MAWYSRTLYILPYLLVGALEQNITTRGTPGLTTHTSVALPKSFTCVNREERERGGLYSFSGLSILEKSINPKA